MGATAKRHESVRHCPTRGSQPFFVFAVLYLHTTILYSILYYATTALAGIVILRVLRARDVSFVGAAVLSCAVLVACVLHGYGLVSWFCCSCRYVRSSFLKLSSDLFSLSFCGIVFQTSELIFV